MDAMRFDLMQDRKGMMWDLALYVPTVVALLSLSAKFYYGDKVDLSYLLLFLGSFFLIAGANRILKTRLMLLPSAPIAIEIEKQKVGFALRNGKRVEILTELRYYPDYAGRSFGLAGRDSYGQRLQFVFHKGQFRDDSAYQAAQKALRER